eukprot:Gb_03031 [translate_table: standard]
MEAWLRRTVGSASSPGVSASCATKVLDLA